MLISVGTVEVGFCFYCTIFSDLDLLEASKIPKAMISQWVFEQLPSFGSFFL